MLKAKKFILFIILVALLTVSISVSAESFDFSVEATFNLSSLAPNKYIIANATATNISLTPYTGNKDVLLIIALYDQNETMVGFACETKSIPYQGTATLSGGLKLPSIVTGYNAKVFMWDGTDINTSNMIPMSNVVIVSG